METDINPLKTSVSEGKALIAAAVTGKGVSTAANASFQTMANNINSISSQEYFTVSFTGYNASTGSYDSSNYYFLSSGTITAYGFTINGRTSGTLQVLGTSFRVPKYGVISMRYNPDLSRGWRSCAITGGSGNNIPAYENDYGNNRTNTVSVYSNTTIKVTYIT